MEKRVLTKYKKLPPEVKSALKKKYPNGYESAITTIKTVANGETASAIMFNYNDTKYIIKYTIKKNKDEVINNINYDLESSEDEWDEDDI